MPQEVREPEWLIDIAAKWEWHTETSGRSRKEMRDNTNREAYQFLKNKVASLKRYIRLGRLGMYVQSYNTPAPPPWRKVVKASYTVSESRTTMKGAINNKARYRPQWECEDVTVYGTLFIEGVPVFHEVDPDDAIEFVQDCIRDLADNACSPVEFQWV